MTDAVIYDIDVLSDGEKIDNLIVCTYPYPDFEERWIKRYKRDYPRIAKRYPNLTIKVTKREETK